jgi:hypothetical protein
MPIHKLLLSIGLLAVAGTVSWYAFFANKDALLIPPASGTSTPQTWECNSDGKICPDGSLVGRTGPACEFVACPPPNATSTTLTTYLGGNVTGLNFTVNPRELISDSRCPQGVQCIWAGTVEVKTAVSTKVGHGEHVFKLNEPRTVGDFKVTLVDVTPAPKAGEEIPESSYRFVFSVEKVQ